MRLKGSSVSDKSFETGDQRAGHVAGRAGPEVDKGPGSVKNQYLTLTFADTAMAGTSAGWLVRGLCTGSGT